MPRPHHDPSRKHPTIGQMKRLEAGQRVILNSSQYEELAHFAPNWVGLHIHESNYVLDQFTVSMTDHRTAEQKQRMDAPRLGIHFDPVTKTLTPSKRGKTK